LGIDLVWVRRVKISFDISALENPKLIIFCKKGRNDNDELKLPVSAIYANSPKQTS
jgi:hypothetical protein